MTDVLIKRELLPCPFCGDKPELPSGEGTQYEIECSGCGQAMASVQICDLMSLEERAADSFTNYRYADEFVERAKKQAIENWNTRAAPRQPEGEAASILLPALRQYMHNDGSGLLAGYEYERTQRIVAELREECEASESQAEYQRGRADHFMAERDTLRQQLADSDAALRESRANDQASMGHLADMRQQRDKLAGLLRDSRELIDHGDFREGHCMCGSGVERHSLGDGHAPVDAGEYYAGQVRERIDAALAEVKPCQESPRPAAM